MRFYPSAALVLSLMLPGLACAAESIKTTEVTKDKLGQLVTVEGKTSSFRPSRGERSPNSFFLKDNAGEIRVVIWPDVYKKIANSKSLETEGTSVQLEGEVAEYREKIELHVPDADQVKIGTAGATATPTTVTLSTTAATTTTR